MHDLTIPRGSEEYVEFTLTDTNGADITDMAVTLAIEDGTERTWVPTVFTELGWWRTTEPVEFDETYSISSHAVWARLDDNPELLIVRLGNIRIVR